METQLQMQTTFTRRNERKHKEGKLRRRSGSVFPRWQTRLAEVAWNLCFLPCVCICVCVAPVCTCEMQTPFFFFFCVGACACVCICVTVVHTCIFLRLHLHFRFHLRRTYEPGLRWTARAIFNRVSKVIVGCNGLLYYDLRLV